jgi:hypothetical protein
MTAIVMPKMPTSLKERRWTNAQGTWPKLPTIPIRYLGDAVRTPKLVKRILPFGQSWQTASLSLDLTETLDYFLQILMNAEGM